METCGKQKYHRLLAERAPWERVPVVVELTVKPDWAKCSALSDREWIRGRRS